ncbi:MAG: hypothetical protein AAFY57_12375 [Cyanobacteria bacterium J06642_2]
MRDAEVLQLLQDAIAKPGLTLQVERLERHLRVSIASTIDDIPDREALAELIREEIGTFVPDVDEVGIWMRARDSEGFQHYQTFTLTEATQSPSPTRSPVAHIEIVQATSEPVAIPEMSESRSLPDFCFVKNKLLLSAPLPPPHPKVARAVLAFHGWDSATQLAIAPVLADFFQNPNPNLADRIPAEQRQWLVDLAAFRQDRRTSVAAWLSRYCSKPEAALRELDRKLSLEPQGTDAENDAEQTGDRSSANSPAPIQNLSSHPQAIEKALNANLAARGIRVELSVVTDDLRITVDAKRFPEPHVTTAAIYDALRHLHVPHLREAKLYGLNRARKAIWKRAFRLPTAPADDTPVDRVQFDHPLTNVLAFPVALALGAILNTVLPFLMLPLHIWIHEFGHATVAWLSGYRALPLPFGWTSIAGQKQVLVYGGVLFLLGLFIWQGWREKRRWPIALGSALLVLQFYMTWMMSERQFQIWVVFGGIGGEFYLSAFLMACFYFRLPDRWRWDFWRFVVLVIAAATFCQAFWRWHLIDLGVAQIPWGTIFGGSGDSGGDMNQLNWAYGWSSDRIITAYRRLGELCALGLLGIYLFFAAKMNPQVWFDLRQRVTLWWFDRQHPRRQVGNRRPPQS